MEVLPLRLKIYLLVISAACFLAHSVQSTDISYCTKKAYPIKVSDVVISPYPVETGKPTTFTIKASSNQGFSGGKLILAVSYFGVKVHGETDDICEKTSCPVSAGKFELSHTQTLPSVTPPVSVKFSSFVGFALSGLHFSPIQCFVHKRKPTKSTGFQAYLPKPAYFETIYHELAIGLYTLKMRIQDEKNHELTCISFKFKIGFGVYDESM